MRTMRHGDISLTIPDNWQDATQIFAIGPEVAGFRPNLSVGFDAALDDEEEADGYAERMLPAARRMFKDLKVVSEGDTKIGPYSGYLREQTFTASGRKLVQLHFMVRRGGRFYNLTFTHLAEEVEDARELAQQLIASAHLGGAAEAAALKIPGAGTIRS